ncbi:protein Spindly-like [Anneissia japonica]|uniref:protein Spindly-like n=1 Tax=Anneissia japonica TaxID=1529436 RepID=UPI001425593A|nr:protein Spindly-like [Anneissia japonica]
MDLEGQIRDLQQELDLKSNNLKLAAEVGNTLLEQNKDLEEQLEKASQIHCAAIEELEQEKYSLQLKLNAKENFEKYHESELQNLRDQIEKENAKKEEIMTGCHEKQISMFQDTKKSLEADLEKAATIEVQLKEKVEELQKLLSESHELLQSQQGMSTTATEETIELHSLIADMEEEKAYLRIELKDKKDELLQLSVNKEGLEQQIAELSEALMQKEKESVSYYNALERCREEVVDLQLQLDNVALESVNTEQKGNSLFGEVEDKRKEIERKYISLKVQYEAAKKQLTMKKDQVHKMKFQIATLLQMSTPRADSIHIEHLRQQLNQSQFEVKTLTDKLRNIEVNQVSSGIGDELLQLYNEEIAAGGAERKVYTDFVKQQLITTRNTLSEVREELQTQRMLLMSKSDCLMKCERKLYAAQSVVDQERGKNIKLTLKIDELKRKLSPDYELTQQKERTGFVEKIPMKNKQKLNEKSSNGTEDDDSKVKSINSQPEVLTATSNLENNQNIVNDYSMNKKKKKSVSVAETVEVFTDTGDVDQVELRSDSECKTAVETPSKTELEEVGKRGGKKQHKVMFVKQNTNECSQQ